ncbi:MAG: Fe-S cluster assembly protein SufD [Anaerolineales bacterium]
MSTRTVVKRKQPAVRRMTADFTFSEADVRNVSADLNEPDWLAEKRVMAWKRFKDMPLPTLKDEPWRRTDIRSIPADTFELKPAEDVEVNPALLESLAADQHGSLLVVRPGHSPQWEHDAEVDKQGVIFTDWATAVGEHASILEKYLGTIVAADEGKFSALAASLARDGVLLYVPKDVHLEQPLHAVIWPAGVETAFFSRLMIVLEQGASATFVHELASPTRQDGEAMHAGIVEISIGKGAELTFVEVQNLGKNVWNFSHERAKIKADGNLNWIYAGVGSHLTKNFSDIDLLGEGAEVRMSAFYIAIGEQHLDHDTQQNHLAPYTTSDLLFKGALLDHSRSVWQGMIYVAPGAQITDGYQANRNLLLSENARADSIPGLEILADDVRCTHGATVGQLEAEPIFYLMSRGLPRDMAERLVIDGFFAPIMERIPFERVRQRFKRMIDEKLNGDSLLA